MTNKKLFSFEQLMEFFNKHRICSYDEYLTTFNFDESDMYLAAFKHYAETKEDLLPEYIKIKKILINLGQIDMDNFQNLYDINVNKELSDIYYILNYKGYWNVDNIANIFGMNRQKIMRILKEIEDGFPTLTAEKDKESCQLQEEFNNSYYKAKRLMSKNELDEFFLYNIKQNISKRYLRDITDVTNVNYPVLVFLYKNNKVACIRKVTKKLDASLSNYRRSENFDEYAYIHISEDVIEDILAEAMVRYNPIDMYSNAITIKNSIYRTLNHIKRRYKQDSRIDLRVIKKLIEMYEIPVYNLNNGMTVVDKDLFDEAVKKYFG